MSQATLQALIEAVEFYLYDMKVRVCTQASIDYYTQILKELEEQLEK